ncbi:MAG TPA: DMT family transporter [Motilibacteraceae bacterium]|nr:DMT family transporter [Motilibacteraceae bacterium]
MSRRGAALFAAMCVIWGVPYLLIKVAVGEVSPAVVVLARTAVGALLLVPVAAARGQLRPLLPRWKALLSYTVIEICVPWLLLGFAEQRISSSLAGLLIAAVPIVGVALSRVPSLSSGAAPEPLTRTRLVGLLMGVAGVAALVGLDVGSASWAAVLALAGVAVCYAWGPALLARHLSDLPGLGVVAGSLVLAALLSLPLAVPQLPSTVPSGPVLLALLGLAVVCTATAFLVFFVLVAEIGPARATVITYVNPAVAVLLGVAVLGEPLTATTLAGFALVLAGSVLATRRGAPAAVEPAVTVPAQPAAREALAPAAAEQARPTG